MEYFNYTDKEYHEVVEMLALAAQSLLRSITAKDDLIDTKADSLREALNNFNKVVTG